MELLNVLIGAFAATLIWLACSLSEHAYMRELRGKHMKELERQYKEAFLLRMEIEKNIVANQKVKVKYDCKPPKEGKK